MDQETSITLHRASQHQVQPWKNGQGKTQEIAKCTDVKTANGPSFVWRLSIATIEQEGPFSRFPGTDRTLMLLDGKGLQLTVAPLDTVCLLDRRYNHISFDGAAKVDCGLKEGGVTAFNVMTSQAGGGHEVIVFEQVTQGHSLPSHQGPLLIFCTEKAVTVQVSGQNYKLTQYDMLELPQPPGDGVLVSSEMNGACAVVRIFNMGTS